jgi:hypothetical protein
MWEVKETRGDVLARGRGDFRGLNKASWEPEDRGKTELLVDAKEDVRDKADCDVLGAKPLTQKASGKMGEIVEVSKERV